MQSWPSPAVPSLAERSYGYGPAVHVHDSATGALQQIDPPERARLYVCGITPYDATHLGHANTYLAFDLLQRVWRDRGLDVAYTQNVTDVDDPLLERATATGMDWQELAERETQLFREDMEALRVIAPDDYVGAVEAIPSVIEMVAALREAGAVYEVDGDLYFDVHADDAFGSVGNFDETTMRRLFGERGGDPDRPGKRDPLDCLVWQAARAGEPSWPSPFGDGRPGWHIECAAIALEHLGRTFDVQGGGSDLVFPHHEMSAAEAAVATGAPFARYYVHGGMVGFEGEKMSKSKGNLVLVSRLRADGHEPAAIRLALLAHHYRGDWEWTGEQIDAAIGRLKTWRAATERATALPAAAVIAELREALADDLNAPRALAAVDAWAAGDGDDPEAPADVALAIDALLGVDLRR
ncbi:cysteine--1-D-myo-inosityl 2-amino-2-deoxy-alpha-D-glucopyranoside ligase [Aeromicrobium sp. YIM 150415]|uniref:cysteine--1-D-myo-inosityl 2-amino-2-deoxy-alpha-D-glucopyranoside ligase n=1 Tax=Aeromicrobium sp. YIM 150415 TaxID=2803912 RepID=UPI00196284DB|nr:cysteine--1-D-myo-inosityl 2-amino-2-deoxy-alpha-D-glucopyranoside ligase [Aeromicrobium sp. YIM 150415]MBM9462491.1 cysteine--1-D-myo-inosityl 2-amino-2-deoxy-alpha-D-glucopyranoside ligase [Aeromicrobium sp. YIM 150415]